MSTSVVSGPGTTTRPGAFGNAVHLVCRECRAIQDLGPFYACQECFGPLEIGYDFPAVTRAGIEAGPKNIWRYQSLLPVPADITSSPNMEPGFTRLIKADNLGRELGIKNLWVKDDSGNPPPRARVEIRRPACGANGANSVPVRESVHRGR